MDFPEFVSHVAALGAAFLANVLVLVGTVRWFSGRCSVVKSLLVAYAVGLVLLVPLSRLIPSPVGTMSMDRWAMLFVDAAVYTVVSYCWFHYVNIGEASVRIRMLWEISNSDAPLSREDLLARYGAAHIIDRRLERLVTNGQLIERGGRYVLGVQRMIVIQRLFDLLKFVVLGKWPER